MDTARIVAAAQEIERLTAGLKWLYEHGAKLQHRDRDSFSAQVHAAACCALPGGKEADVLLSAAARVLIQDIVAHAIRDAENTIEIHKDTLRRQVAA